jgi:hypothetical protein
MRADATGRHPVVAVPSNSAATLAEHSPSLLVRTKAPQHPRLAALKASACGGGGRRREPRGHGRLRCDREMLCPLPDYLSTSRQLFKAERRRQAVTVSLLGLPPAACSHHNTECICRGSRSNLTSARTALWSRQH